MSRDRLKKYFTFGDFKELLDLIEAQSEIVETSEDIQDCRDLKDNIVLECAVTGKADFIVTADPDLLILNPFRGIKVVSPNEFLQVLGKE